ncbi:MAG: Rrf2 family transcriptional regulator [Gemmatimonadales bacterium]
MGLLSVTAAVSILTELAIRPGDTQQSEWLAATRGMDGGTTRRLLARLARAGLVRMRRGPGGGALLGRFALEITLLDVVLAVAPARSNPAPERTSRVAGRRRNLGPLVGEVLAAADRCRDDFLRGITIQDLAVRLEALDRESARQARASRRAAISEPRAAPRGGDGTNRELVQQAESCRNFRLDPRRSR